MEKINKNRRGFISNLLLGGFGIITGVEGVEASEKDIISPIKNPKFSQAIPWDEIILDLKGSFSKHKNYYTTENNNLSISVSRNRRANPDVSYFIQPKVPMQLSDMYTAIRELFRRDDELIKFPFPIMSITPEMFVMNDDWNIDITMLRNGGIKLIDGLEYACVSILSEKGVITHNGYKVPNDGLVPIKDGVIQGNYKYNESDIEVPLKNKIEEVGCIKTTYQQYRIV